MQTLHPIAVLDRVIDEYRSYLRSEFRARDEVLRRSLEQGLERARFLAQEPFFQAYRPFKSEQRWSELGLDARLARVMERRSGATTAYLHQSQAIRYLLDGSSGCLAVTTGTGSGKTECFLLPVIQNAIEDSSRFKQPGLTGVLVYPMNALANDQELRIREYLEESGHTHVKVARYDRSTSERERATLRQNPPHILLTNYVMLEYLLVRPSDREALFKDHRCRYVVLDEVHSYRGSLGANIALLCRRLRAHLGHAEQGWQAEDRANAARFPVLRFVATSATIKSVDETQRTREEVTRLRREAVQEFVSAITGAEALAIRVISEERVQVHPPPEAGWAVDPAACPIPAPDDAEGLHRALCALAGLAPSTEPEKAAAKARIFWYLSDLLAQRPRSAEEIATRIQREVPERGAHDLGAIHHEVNVALAVGAALGDRQGSLRLRAHRFIRGGWRFHRCVDPSCGALWPMGEGRCRCGSPTAPLLLCRSCGADALQLCGAEEPEKLEPFGAGEGEHEWVLYDTTRHQLMDDEDEATSSAASTSIRPGKTKKAAKELKGKKVVEGFLHPSSLTFGVDAEDLGPRVTLAPGRSRCLVCGGSGGARSVLTSVALGTSAALRVLAEGVVEGLAREHARLGAKVPKERVLIFADSRQDAAHQARFITYAGRYDRMRRRVVRALEDRSAPMSIDELLNALVARGLELNDNPHLQGNRARNLQHLPRPLQEKARAWEEAPLLDDLAVSANYRGTLFSLGLVGVRYGRLENYVLDSGGDLAAALGLTTGQLAYLCRCLLDDVRVHSALSRPMLSYHPLSPQCPDAFHGAEWERKMSRPTGYACGEDGRVASSLDKSEVPEGLTLVNFWRRSNRGRPPRMQAMFRHLVHRMVNAEPDLEDVQLKNVLEFLKEARLVDAQKLFGFRKARLLLQVNAEGIELELVAAQDRRRCSVCNVRLPWAPLGSPCPVCHGVMEAWASEEVERNRYVERIRTNNLMPLRAGEHTAQVLGSERMDLEERFKSDVDPLNVLACSPTLEMGIDVGGLDAVLMRNVPPRPDNYAQRGGRAGRRSRVGVVLGYARSTPHDQYFYDKPAEMIAGEVAAPAVGLGNRDVVLRHLTAIAMGSAEPGLAGRMGEYVSLKGEVFAEPVDQLVAAFEQQFEHAAELALEAWGPEVLGPAGLDSKERLLTALQGQSAKIRSLFEAVGFQIAALQQRVKQWSDVGVGKWSAINAMDLSRRLLGLPPGDRNAAADADDRSAGNPMRRFAEFGLLPGYEFPTEPATLRLLKDRHEEEPISVARRFGLSQYQPDAWAHARGHRWRVVGLDMASPWNPKNDEPSWVYRVCQGCGLRFDTQAQVRCPRCGSNGGRENAGYAFGGFIAVQDDSPILEEEDRFSRAGLLRCYPQWDGEVVARLEVATRWFLEMRRGEHIRWLNEWKPPTNAELESGLVLHDKGRGFYLCPSCGRLLKPPADDAASSTRGKRKARSAAQDDAYGHAPGCAKLGSAPKPLAITTESPACSLRILINLPWGFPEDQFERWGMSLGSSLSIGMRQLYMLDGAELEFELEGPWVGHHGEERCLRGALTFIDAALGGSGFLEKAATELHLVARRALDHLDHPDCESACYRCLKSYQNQRHHALLSWPHALPDLESLASAAPRPVPPRVCDKFNARAWLDAYAAGVGSPLELKFWKLLEAKGIPVVKQFVIQLPGDLKPLTVADFALPEQRLAIYIDGAAFHQGENLRRDRYIRARLRQAEPPWTVVELTAQDLATGLKPLQELLGEFPTVVDPEPVYVIDDAGDGRGPEQPETPPAPNDEFPGYECLSEITGGGMARCFKVRDRSSRELRFLKAVRTGSQDAHALQRELEIYQRLQHVEHPEHLLEIHAVLRLDQQTAIVTELADGGDLKQWVDRQGPKGLSTREALTIAQEIASGLFELHEADVVHRDLKPQNILRAGPRWKLADFGIAKNRAKAAPGVTFQQSGSYGYTPPEQFDGAAADPSADVYSFGKVLTYLLTGDTDPDKIRVEVPELRRLVQRCVQYTPENRPTMLEVRQSLETLLGAKAGTVPA